MFLTIVSQGCLLASHLREFFFSYLNNTGLCTGWHQLWLGWSYSLELPSRGQIRGRSSQSKVHLSHGRRFLPQCPVPARLGWLPCPMALYNQDRSAFPHPVIVQSAKAVPDASWSCSVQMHQLFVTKQAVISLFCFCYCSPHALELILSWESIFLSFSVSTLQTEMNIFFSLWCGTESPEVSMRGRKRYTKEKTLPRSQSPGVCLEWF